MEVNKTLLMGKTNFEMRGNLAQKEPKMLSEWEKDDLYHQILKKNEKSPCFMLHDGPPYANGDMHCGHVLNRLLKDIIIRFKSMDGYYAPFYPGWDTHGLPIENAVTKKGVNRKTTPPDEFLAKCEEFAKSQVARQRDQVKRLGILADFEHRYVTLDKEFEKSQIQVFAKMAEDGLIFKGLKPVYWSPSSESALAEAEIEYYDVKAKTIFVKFPVIDGKGLLSKGDYFVIWTTTPWTIPANLAIALNPDMEYGLFKTNEGNLVFLVELEEKMKETLHLTECELIKTFKGRETEYITTKHPLYDRETLVIQGAYVTSDAGSGCVHIAPGHGEDDFNVCKKYKLPPYCPVDEHGKMDSSTGPRLAGLFYEDANEEVLKMLDEAHVLMNVTEITHSYPHDWRTKKPVIFRATPQWFCSIDKIRDQLLDQIEKVNWIPSWGRIRMHNMIKDRGDWCISRQRAWGVPLPIIYDKDGNALMEKEIFDHIADLVGEYGSSIWVKKSCEELLPDGYAEAHKDLAPFRKEKDIMDVWFDSGSSFNGVLVNRDLKYPSDLYLEGSDQYRGWFNSSLIISVALNGVAPYKEVVSHGFVMDEHWEKMSKSKGNGIDPLKIASTYGSDILRLWTSLIDYQQDARISESIIKQNTEIYRKIRNTFKFMLGNLSNGSIEDTFKKEDIQTELEIIDQCILAELEDTKNKVIKYMNEYNFISAMSELTKFISDDLSSFYLDITKDVLYCNAKDSKRRLQVQTVLNECTFTLMRLFNPILPFTMDEVNENYPLKSEENVQFYKYPEITNEYNPSLLEDYALIKKLRDDILKALEEARKANIIGSSQEATVIFEVKDSQLAEILESIDEEELERLFIVSKIMIKEEVEDGLELKVSNVLVKKNDGVKCDRCWNYKNNDEIVEVEGVHLCPRCLKAMKQ